GQGGSLSVNLAGGGAGGGTGSTGPPTFQPQEVIDVQDGAPHAPAIVDLNGDGKPDLAFAAQVGDVVTMLGNGDGTFQTPHTTGAPGGGTILYSIATGDFNGDGKPD